MHERFLDLLETIFGEEGTPLTRGIPEREGSRETERILPKADTTDQLFHRHSSDLAIGGESL